jgi:hydroxymethylpyrimidine kinase / phosphomethylpyrimidine kinase / thiamine-phosphate diphosphorylase
MYKVLTIAGSDSGGGSGIQGDLKTIISLGAYGMSVVTALTAQNTLGIQAIVPVKPEFVAQQMDSVLSDIGADCIKIGMLANADIVRVVAKKIAEYKIEKVVIDPVLLSTSGQPLLDDEGREALVRELFPLGYVVTPNIPEAEILTKRAVTGPADMKKAARKIRKMGPKNVLVKGGHLEDTAVDILHDGNQDYEFSVQKITTRHTHGTGCTLASALATFLAQGLPLMMSIDQAKRYVYRALRFSLPIGGGIGPANHYAYIAREIGRTHVLDELDKALERLRRLSIGHLIPEVQSNLAYAIPYAESVDDVASFPGRIMRLANTVGTFSSARFGAARQIHLLVLAAMEYDLDKRAAMAITYSDPLVNRIRSLGYLVAEFDRTRTPPDLLEEEGSVLAWGVQDVMEELGQVPDAIFDRGAVGKVPLIRLFANSPGAIVDLVAKL